MKQTIAQQFLMNSRDKPNVNYESFLFSLKIRKSTGVIKTVSVKQK